MPKRILITGAAGFIGANLAHRLVADGHDVTLFVRPGSALWRLDNLTPPVAVDLADADAVHKAVIAASPEWIFHTAAHGGYSTQTDAARIVQTNLLGTMNVVNAAAAAGCEAFVNAGSSSEYGFKDHPPAEDEPAEPNSDYAVTKVAATLYCSHAARRSGLRATTLRLYSVYGPFEEPTRLIPQLLLKARQRELPPLVDPAIGRDFVYIDDVLRAFVLAAERGRPGAVYNIGTGVQTSLSGLVDVAREIFGITVQPQWGSMPNRAWDTAVWRANNGRARNELGWTPRVSLEDGLRTTMKWLEAPGVLARYQTATAPPRS